MVLFGGYGGDCVVVGMVSAWCLIKGLRRGSVYEGSCISECKVRKFERSSLVSTVCSAVL